MSTPPHLRPRHSAARRGSDDLPAAEAGQAAAPRPNRAVAAEAGLLAASRPDARPEATAPIPAIGGHGRPVFADLSGRRQRRMRLFGLGLGAGLLACLLVMAVGLLGGPKASFIPWSTANSGGSAGPAASGTRLAHAGATPSPAPDAAIMPRASSGPSPSQSASGGKSSPPATGSASPSPSATNRSGHTPPGLNRSPSPHPSRRASVG